MRIVTLLLVFIFWLGGCSNARKGDGLTIEELQDQVKEINVEPSNIPATDTEEIKKSYEEFLKDSDQAELRAQAMKRLADLELMEQEGKEGEVEPQEKALPKPVDAEQAVKLYENLLNTYPNDPRNDQVLYQLGNAYDMATQPEKTLVVLNRLVREFPDSKYALESHFRRGEINFSLRNFKKAEAAYQKVMSYGKDTDYYLKALYKFGWTQYQQYDYSEALASFFQVLDRKIGTDVRFRHYVNKNPLFKAGDRELVSDTLRVISLCLYANETGATLDDFVRQYSGKLYESLVFQRLGELYIKRDRITDATDTYKKFIQLHPKDPQAVLFNIRILEAYEKGDFDKLILNAKEKFVDRFNFKQPYWINQNETVRVQVAPYLKKYLVELAKHYHGRAQDKKEKVDYDKAEKWYRLYVYSFPDDKTAAQMQFLLAELLNEQGFLAQAAKEYESAAYKYGDHKKANEAGYAAILAYTELEKKAQSKRRKNHFQRLTIDSSLRFADRFPQDRRSGQVLAKAALSLYEAREYLEATSIAEKILNLSPPPPKALQIKAWTVVAHSYYEQSDYQEAENAYRQLLALTDRRHPDRKEFQERLAASVYKQGEQMRKQGNEKAAFQQFQRVSQLAPGSSIGMAAQFDAATSLLAQKQWLPAAQALNEFRSRNPNHQLSRQIPEKLYTAYLKAERWDRAAAELENMARIKTQPEEQRTILLRAAELYEKSGQLRQSRRVYKKYVSRYPRPVEQAVEVMFTLSKMADKQGDRRDERYWLKQILDAGGGNTRGLTDRTRYLAATAAFQLAEPTYQAFNRVKLVHPLKTSMKRKKTKMDAALKAFGKAAEYQIAEITTASTFKIAQIYNEFGKALLKSQRPKGLKQDELMQYEVLLEERAFPFEEKAIKIHETNVKRVNDGIYDEWVQKSFQALGKLVPARYAKIERSEVYINVLR